MLPFQASVDIPQLQSPRGQHTPQMQVARVMKAVSNVQVTVQRSLATTRELDERFMMAQDRANTSAGAYLEDTADDPDPDRLRQVRAEQRSALIIAEKKVSLVSEAHDLVDRQIERLDAAIEQLEGEYGPMAAMGGPFANRAAVGGAAGKLPAMLASVSSGGGVAAAAAAGLALWRRRYRHRQSTLSPRKLFVHVAASRTATWSAAITRTARSSGSTSVALALSLAMLLRAHGSVPCVRSCKMHPSRPLSALLSKRPPLNWLLNMAMPPRSSLLGAGAGVGAGEAEAGAEATIFLATAP